MARNWYIYVVILVLVLVLAVATPISAMANYKLEPYDSAYVQVDTFLNLRLQPQGEIIGSIPKNAVVTILSEIDRDGYYYIRVNKTNEVGYVYGEYLCPYYFFDEDVSCEDLFRPTPTPTPKPTPKPTPTAKPDVQVNGTVSTIDGFSMDRTLVVTSGYKLNFRYSPSLTGERIKYLYRGNTLQLLSYNVYNNYIYVKETSTGLVGYVDYRYIGYKNGSLIKSLTVTDTPVSNGYYCNCYCQYCNCKCHQW